MTFDPNYSTIRYVDRTVLYTRNNINLLQLGNEIALWSRGGIVLERGVFQTMQYQESLLWPHGYEEVTQWMRDTKLLKPDPIPSMSKNIENMLMHASKKRF